MKLLQVNDFHELSKFSQPMFKFVSERISTNPPNQPINYRNKYKDTGRYHLFLDLNAPADITEIDITKDIVFQEWELIEEKEINGELYCLFEFFGNQITYKYNGKIIGILTGDLYGVLRSLPNNEDTKHKLRNTIGLERIKDLF